MIDDVIALRPRMMSVAYRMLGREPGVVFTSSGAVIHVVALRIEGGVRAVYMTNNPDKLSRWSVAEVR
jgi:hypothetical protein